MNERLNECTNLWVAPWHQILTSDTEREAALAEAARRQATFQEEHVFFFSGKGEPWFWLKMEPDANKFAVFIMYHICLFDHYSSLCKGSKK